MSYFLVLYKHTLNSIFLWKKIQDEKACVSEMIETKNVCVCTLS